jgi:signal transduction histidine kinase
MIKNWLKFGLSLVLSFLCVSAAFAQKASADEAVAMVKKGVAYVKEHGKEKALAAFSDPTGPFVKGELYLFVYPTNGEGTVLAHGQNPKMIGKKLIDMKDTDGLPIIKDMTAIANSPEGKGWYKYKWPNSLTKAVEAKQSYVERVGDMWIGCGIYQ